MLLVVVAVLVLGSAEVRAAPTAPNWLCRGCVYEAAEQSPAPLLVVLHGDGQKARAMADVWSPATRRRGIGLLALACPEDHGCPGSYWRWNGHPRWLDAQVQMLIEERPAAVDPHRVWLTAWSGGASYLGARATDLSDRWAAIVLVGGGMPPSSERCPRRHPPVHFLVGDANPLHELARDLRDYYQGCSVSVSWDVRPRADHAGEMRALVAGRDDLLAWLEEHPKPLPSPGTSSPDTTLQGAAQNVDAAIIDTVGTSVDARRVDDRDTKSDEPHALPSTSPPRRGCLCAMNNASADGWWLLASVLLLAGWRRSAQRPPMRSSQCLLGSRRVIECHGVWLGCVHRGRRWYGSAMPRTPAQKRSKGVSPATETVLAVSSDAEQFAAMLRERDNLLKKIAGKKGQIDAAAKSFREAMDLLSANMPAIWERQKKLNEEIHSLFSKLLAKGRLGRDSRRAVVNLYEQLQACGILEPPGRSDEPGAPSEGEEPGAAFDGDPRQGDADEGFPFANDRAPRSAAHAGGAPGRDSLRELFRRLAVALHPDRVSETDEQQRRTEIMKEVTRAYEEGDFARLVQIERAWLAADDVTVAGASTPERHAALLRAIEELRVQFKSLTQQLTEVRRRSQGLSVVVSGIRARTPGRAVKDTLEILEEQLESLQEIRDFVEAFYNRKMTVATFLAGPACFRTDGDEMSVHEALVSMMLEAIESNGGSKAGSGPARRARTRSSKRTKSVPF